LADAEKVVPFPKMIRSTQAPRRRSIRKGALRIECLTVPPLGNNVFILFEDGSDSAIVVDVAQGARDIAARLSELELRAKTIVNTHGHTDHTAEDDLLVRLTGAKLAIHELDAYRLALDDEASKELGIAKKPILPDIQLVDGDILEVGKDTRLKVIHTPGHTEGSVCLYDEVRGQLFSGDTIFANGYGRVDGFGADPRAMVNSLRKLMAMPASTEVYPGHGSFTKIEDEGWLKAVAGEQGESGSVD
jgi:hydroxyacylglutathione hydrolase